MTDDTTAMTVTIDRSAAEAVLPLLRDALAVKRRHAARSATVCSVSVRLETERADRLAAALASVEAALGAGSDEGVPPCR